ncbi:TP53RK family protein [Megaselia abdita]
MKADILKQGAEGRLYIGESNGVSCLVKERFVKSYRHPVLDNQITRQRMKAETKASERCLKAGILAPKVLHMDLKERKIYMEYFDKAITVKEFVNKGISKDPKVINELFEKIGTIIGTMHSKNIIHGDLTTSNILMNPKTEDFSEYDVIMIDFGLSHYEEGAEDKGVDLYVLERALLSTHSELPELFEIILKSYKKVNSKEETTVIAKFEEVRARGRKRTMIG